MALTDAADTAADKLERLDGTLRKLSDDIGNMAHRIGDMAERIGAMAERIGTMADRILENQRIQSDNLNHSQDAQLDALRVMGSTLKDNQALLAELVRELRKAD